MKYLLALMAMLASITSIAQINSNVDLKYHWQDESLVGSAAYNNTYNEVWGYAKDGREYAIIGSTAGTHFFDVTDPVNTKEVGFVKGRHFEPKDIIHRDYHDYKDYLYAVADEGASSLQIIDLSYLPDSVSVVYDSNELIKNAHNIFIDTATAKLYACNVRTGEPRYANFQVYDISNPIEPIRLFEENRFGVHDIFARNDTAYLNSGNDGMIVYDFTNGSNPQIMGTLTSYTDQGYNHSGWADQSGKTYYMLDETHGMRIKSLDASNISDLQELAVFGSDIDVNSIAHNAIWRDNYLFVSYYHDGLQIFDVSDPRQPKKVGYYDTYLPNDHESYRGAWGVYPSLPSGTILVSDMQSGLYVLSAPKFIGTSEIDVQEIAVNPNPFTNQFRIELPENNRETMTIQITDTKGAIVYQNSGKNLNSVIHFDTDLGSGVYMLSIKTETEHYTQKLIRY